MRGRKVGGILGGFRAVAEHVASIRQDGEGGYWFGDGPKAGVAPDSEIRIVAVGSEEAEETDISCFTWADPYLRSVYQKLVMGCDATIGLIEMGFTYPPTQPYPIADKWLQISIYEDAGNQPGARLGRCVPLPLAILSPDDCVDFIIPLWVPLAVTDGQAIWVGVSPKAYTGPAEVPPDTASGWPLVAQNIFVNTRGDRVLGAATFIKAGGPNQENDEPPLTDVGLAWWNYEDDIHLFMRLYEDPSVLDLPASEGVGTPAGKAAIPAMIARPVSGRIESAYIAGVRPGFATFPWSSLGHGWGSRGGGVMAHNQLQDIDEGETGYYAHLTREEYLGNWLHRLRATTADEWPLEGIRTSALVNAVAGSVLAKHKTSGDMVDGFGAGVLFQVEDSAGVANTIAGVYGVRAGADNTGVLAWQTAVAGAMAERLRLTASGLVYTPTTFDILANTTLGSDTSAIRIASGGAAGISRGPYISLIANQYNLAGYKGALLLVGGGSGEGGTYSDAVVAWASRTILTGNLRAIDGTVGAPSFSFSSDTNSGIYSPGADLFGIVTAGVEAWRWDASGHYLPGAAGTRNIGSTTAEVANVYIASNKLIYLGDAQQATIGWSSANSRLEILVP